jgi:hypothetical protein
MGIGKNVSWCDPMGARPETAKLNWTLIRGRRVSVIAGLVTVVSVIVAVGVIWTCTGCIYAAIRQSSRRRKSLPDRSILPEGSASPSPYWNTITLPYGGTPVSICENNRVVAAKSDTEFGSLQTVSSIM